jgi:hypothetical protein
MSDQDDQKIADSLKAYQPGFLPYPIFEQIARLVALPIIEFIPLRMAENGQVEVLLIERVADDPLWPGALHTPGTVIRATDLAEGKQENWPAFDRILKDELNDTEVSAPHYVGSIFHESKRGAEQAQLYWVEVAGEPKTGKFYPAESLPDNFIESQRAFVRAAVDNFRQQN